LTGDEAHYALHVLRLRDGDSVALFDGAGHEADATIRGRDGSTLALDVGPVSAQEQPPRRLRVGAACPKGERADWMVEKLTEIGIVELVWLDLERSATRLGAAKLERHRRVALAAARQCGRATLPALSAGGSLDELLARPASRGFIADRSAPASLVGVGALGPELALLIGPEGGWARGELEAAARASYTGLRVGPWTLRTETAAVAGAALLLGA
jgi:16S rRNA (uracil1498-N3)-methyltransferase